MITQEGEHTHDCEQHREYTLYPHIVPIQEMLGYTDVQEPIFGKELALYHPITGRLLQLSSKEWHVFHSLYSNQHPMDIIEADAIIQRFQEQWIAFPKQEGIYLPITPSVYAEAELYMETTELCNFLCPGCATGMDIEHSQEKYTFDDETLSRILEKAIIDARQKGFKSIRIKWAGGEALLPISRKLIERAQVRIEALQAKYPDILIKQVLLTNGSFLAEEVVQQIKKWGIHVAVSLWGVGKENDRARGIHRKQDTYPYILEGIRRLQIHEVDFNIHHVVTPYNAGQFDTFLRAMWDPNNKDFIGTKEYTEPIALSVSFFRPQTSEQLEMLQREGYTAMVKGVRKGFKVMIKLLQNDIHIPSLQKFDYLQLFDGIAPMSCGTGFNYLAVGPHGYASCHEALSPSMRTKLPSLDSDINMFDGTNAEYQGKRHLLMGMNMKFHDMDETTQTILALHGGTGCPRTIQDEWGELGHAASISKQVYAPLLQEILSLETMIRISNTSL